MEIIVWKFITFIIPNHAGTAAKNATLGPWNRRADCYRVILGNSKDKEIFSQSHPQGLVVLEHETWGRG